MGPICPRPSQGNFWDLPGIPNEKLPNLPSGSLFIVLLGNSVPIAVWKRGYVLFPRDRTGSSRVVSGRVGSGRNVSPGAGAPLPSPTVPSAAAPPGSGSDGEERLRREAREEEDTAIESER